MMIGELLHEHGGPVLASDQLRAEVARGKSCLVCRHYQYRDGGRRATCVLRQQTSDALLTWGWGPGHGSGDLCRRRASQCDTFEDMRPGPSEDWEGER